MSQRRQKAYTGTGGGRSRYRTKKCLNCDASITVLQNLLDPAAKMSAEHYVEILSYIFGLKQTDHGTFLLRLLNINEYTFCKPCSQLLHMIRSTRQQFIHKNSKDSYLNCAVLSQSQSKTNDANESSTMNTIAPESAERVQQQAAGYENKADHHSQRNNVPSPSSFAQSKSGNNVQPVHVVIDDEVEIIGQSTPPVVSKTSQHGPGPAGLPNASNSLGLSVATPKQRVTVKRRATQYNTVTCDSNSVATAKEVTTSPSSSTKTSNHNNYQRISFLQVVLQAMGASSTGMLSIKGIQQYIAVNYPNFNARRKEWHDTLLAMLQKSEYFEEVHPIPGNCNASFWKISPTCNVPKLIQEAYRKQEVGPALASISVASSSSGTREISTMFPKSDLVITSVFSSVAGSSKDKPIPVIPPQRQPELPDSTLILGYSDTTSTTTKTTVTQTTISSSSGSDSSETTKRRSVDQIQDTTSNERSSDSKVRKLNDEVNATSIPETHDIMIPDSPPTSNDATTIHSSLTDSDHTSGTKTVKVEKHSLNKEKDVVENDHLTSTFKSLNSPDFEIISSDDDTSICEIDQFSAKPSSKVEKKQAATDGTNFKVIQRQNPNHLENDLELISSDEEILDSDDNDKVITIKSDPSSDEKNSDSHDNNGVKTIKSTKSAQSPKLRRSCEPPNKLQPVGENSIVATPKPSEVSSIEKLKTDLLDAKIPDLLPKTMSNAELSEPSQPTFEPPKPTEQKRCMILLQNSKVAAAHSSSTAPPVISIRNDIFEEGSTSQKEAVSTPAPVPVTSKIDKPLPSQPSTPTPLSDHASSSKQISCQNFAVIETPQEVQALKTLLSSSVNLLRDQLQGINENINGLETRCNSIKSKHIVHVSTGKIQPDEWGAFVFAEITEVMKRMTDMAQNLFLILDQKMIEIRALIPDKVHPDKTPIYKPHTTTTTLHVDTLAKYFKIAIQAEDYLKMPEYKNFSIVLKIIKYKVLRILKHFITNTSKDSTDLQNLNDAYFYNICNFLKSREKSSNPVSSHDAKAAVTTTGVTAEEDWPMEKAISIWDQVKLFNDTINVDIVNLDHNLEGISRFECQLAKVCTSAQKRKQLGAAASK